VHSRLPILLLAVLSSASLLAAPRLPVTVTQGSLDAFMKRVLEARDENWKKLQQYILDERMQISVRGPSGLPIWGERREFTWFIREGYFIRSPLTVNGVKIGEEDRRKAEDGYLKRARARDKRAEDADRRKGGGIQGEPQPETEKPAGLDAFLAQAQQPAFIENAYFMEFKFDQGRYALAGREPYEGSREVLKIEYYPEQLFRDDEPDPAQQKRDAAKGKEKPNPERDYGLAMQRMMNKVSLVTIWVEPTTYQIVRYTFDNVNMDFLPGAWIFRVDDLKATMNMSQPFKDVWLPKDIEFYFSAMLALGSFNVRYHIDYHDYREATTAARIKKVGGGR
jgi:hypothetical protein